MICINYRVKSYAIFIKQSRYQSLHNKIYRKSMAFSCREATFGAPVRVGDEIQHIWKSPANISSLSLPAR
jgi:hypothetical protein